jgi:hypothetical protein
MALKQNKFRVYCVGNMLSFILIVLLPETIQSFSTKQQRRTVTTFGLHASSTKFEAYLQGNYVPSGLSAEEYEKLKQAEEAHQKSMNYGLWGPRFQPSEVPDGDWMVMPHLWTRGAVDVEASKGRGMEEEQTLTFLQHYAPPSSNTDAALRILCPVTTDDDMFLRYAFEQGQHICAIGLVPYAAISLREQFGPNDDDWVIQEDEGEEEDPLNDGMVVWKHKSERLTLYLPLGDILMDLPELHGTFDIVYDKDAVGALAPESRVQFCERLASYTKEGGVVYTEENYEAVQTNPQEATKNLVIVAKVPKPPSADTSKLVGISFEKSVDGSELVISEIKPNSLFEKSILQEGMVVEKINYVDVRGKPVFYADKLLQEAKAEVTILIKVPQEPQMEDQDQLEEPTSTSKTKKRSILAVVSKNSVQEKLGIRLEEQDGVFHVSKISAESPFQETELREGMEVTHINGVYVIGKGMAFAGSILKGVAGQVTVEAQTDVILSEEGESSTMALSSSLIEVVDKEEQLTDSNIFGKDFEYVATLGEVYKVEGVPTGISETAHILKKRTMK